MTTRELKRQYPEVYGHKLHWYINSATWWGDGSFRCLICNKQMPKRCNNPFQKVTNDERKAAIALHIERFGKKGKEE